MGLSKTFSLPTIAVKSSFLGIFFSFLRRACHPRPRAWEDEGLRPLPCSNYSPACCGPPHRDARPTRCNRDLLSPEPYYGPARRPAGICPTEREYYLLRTSSPSGHSFWPYGRYNKG